MRIRNDYWLHRVDKNTRDKHARRLRFRYHGVVHFRLVADELDLMDGEGGGGTNLRRRFHLIFLATTQIAPRVSLAKASVSSGA